MADSQERQVAHKIRIKDVLEGKFVKQDGMLPSYIVYKGKKISRVNIIGAIISKENNDVFESVVIDDGSGTISARSFEKKGDFNNFIVGDIALLIGKVREYGGEKYIIKEVIKKIEKREWVDLRKLELKLSDLAEPENISEEKGKEVIEEEIETPLKKVFETIKELDSGEGVDFDDIITNADVENCEKIIEELLKTGHIFEIRPGKIKILE